MARINTVANKINLGRKPIDRAHAWHALSRKAKQRLAELRRNGQFGGTPGQAPYWKAQERGLPSAGIVGQGFIETSIMEWRSQVNDIVRQWCEL